MSFFGFCRVWRIYKIEICLCLRISLSKGSLKEVWRCHKDRTLSESVNSVWLKTKFAFEERYFSTNWWGIWMAFLSRGEGIWTSQSSKVQMPGGLPRGGCWSFNLTGIWPYLTLLLKSLRKYMKCHQEQFKCGGLRSNVVNIKQGKNIWIYQSLSLRCTV